MCILSLVYFPKPNREPATVYSIATLDNDPVFASYVNSIILATVYAVHHGITQDSTVYMPAMTLFGKYFLWALKDAIEGKFHELKEMIGIHEKIIPPFLCSLLLS